MKMKGLSRQDVKQEYQHWTIPSEKKPSSVTHDLGIAMTRKNILNVEPD